jgi:L-rhamnose mutarotase
MQGGMTGIAVRDECIDEYKKLHMKREYRYMIFDFSEDKKEVVIVEKAPRDATWKDFMEQMPKNECRYSPNLNSPQICHL